MEKILNGNEKAYCELVEHPEGRFNVGHWFKFRPEWPRGNPEESRAREMINSALAMVQDNFRKTGTIPQMIQVSSEKPGNIAISYRINQSQISYSLN